MTLCSFFVLAPTSSVIPLGDLMFEHRAYPLLAILVPAFFYGLAPALAPAQSRPPGSSATGSRPGFRLTAARAYPVVAAMILLFALNAYARNRVWRSDLSLSADAMTKSPEKPRTIYNYACALRDAGQFETAAVWFERARRQLKPGDRRREADIDSNIEWLRTMIRSESDQPP